METVTWPSVDAQTSTTWHSHTKECGLAIKKDDALIHVTAWMDLTNSALTENQTPKVTDRMIPFVGNIKIWVIHGVRKQTGVYQGLGMGDGGWGVITDEYGASLRAMKMFWN